MNRNFERGSIAADTRVLWCACASCGQSAGRISFPTDSKHMRPHSRRRVRGICSSSACPTMRTRTSSTLPPVILSLPTPSLPSGTTQRSASGRRAFHPIHGFYNFYKFSLSYLLSLFFSLENFIIFRDSCFPN